MSERVAILMPCYNAEKFINETLESLVNQSYENIEIIILDDCSTDNTCSLIEDYKNRYPYIKLYKHPVNKGIIPTRNELFSLTDAPYVALMDADDIAVPERIAKQLRYLIDNPRVSAVGGWHEFFDQQHGIGRFPSQPDDIAAMLFIDNVISNPTMMLRKFFWDKHQLKYDVDYAGAADYKLWTDIYECGEIHNLPAVMIKYRVHASQESTANRERQERVHLRILNENFKKWNISEQPEKYLKSIVWPHQYPHVEKKETAQWFAHFCNEIVNSTHPLKEKVEKVCDIRFRILCQLNDFKGLATYIRSRGITNLCKGRKFGYEFVCNCLLK